MVIEKNRLIFLDTELPSFQFSCNLDKQLKASLNYEKIKEKYATRHIKRYALAQYTGLEDSIDLTKADLFRGRLSGKSSAPVLFDLKRTDAGDGFLNLLIDFPDLSINEIRLTFDLHGNPSIFGGGEQFSHYRLNGHKISFSVEEQGIGRGDQPLTFFVNLAAGAGGDAFTTYYPIPLLILSNGLIFRIENKVPCEVDLRTKGKITFISRGNNLNLVIGKRNDFPSAVRASNRQLKTNPKLIPSAAGTIMGLQGGFKRVLPIVYQSVQAGNPISALWIQDWCGKRITRFGSQLWWTWNTDTLLYPKLKETSDSLYRQGISVWGYINPYLADTGALFHEFRTKGYLIKNKQGKPYEQKMPGFPFYTVDLSNPGARERMKKLIKKNMIDAGLRGWMADFGEWLPHDCILYDGSPAEEYHNRFPEEWAKINREAIQEMGKENEVTFFCRSGYTESAKYAPMFWMGDQTVNFGRHDGLPSTLIALLSSSISGIPINHSDIGGYTSNTFPIVKSVRKKNVLKKWMEMNAFTPVFRTHEGLKADENIQVYDSEELVRFFAQMGKVHGILSAYFNELLKEFIKTGAPLIRPINYAFPEEYQVHQKRPTAFMLGDRWLIFPDLRKTNSRRTLVLPPGNWYHPKYGAEPVHGKIRVKAGIQCFVAEKDWQSSPGKSDADLIWDLMKPEDTPH